MEEVAIGWWGTLCGWS